MAILTSNAASASLFGTSTKVRLRTVDGQVQIRPTDRVSAVNLPKGEVLKDLRAKTPSTSRINANIDALEVGSLYALVAGKYGWVSLVATDKADGAAIRVSAK
jgi:hypothetical protein